jgi:spore maturation protein SpmB
MKAIGRWLAPVMRRLFPDVPTDHPAMSAMIMNIAANMMGLGNAATPFGLKAIRELNRLNRHPGVATNSMVLFLAINTSGVAVLPLGVIAVRAAMGAEKLGSLIPPSLLATACSTLVAILVAKRLQNLPFFSVGRAAGNSTDTEDAASPAAEESDEAEIRGLDDAQEMAEIGVGASRWRMAAIAAFAVALVIAVARTLANAPAETSGLEVARGILEGWLLPVLMAAIMLVGFGNRVKVYESFVTGAREGFEIAVMIIPYLVAILVGVGIFRASGGLEWMIAVVSPVVNLVGFPAEALPMALLRPMSGTGAFGVMMETMTAHGPDSFVGFLVSVLNGSTETTFYVIAVYLGSVQVRASRHTLAACLSADVTGVAAAFVFARLFF